MTSSTNNTDLSEPARYPDPLELLLKKPSEPSIIRRRDSVMPIDGKPTGQEMRPQFPEVSSDTFDRNLGVSVFVIAFVVTPCLFFYAVYVCLERMLG